MKKLSLLLVLCLAFIFCVNAQNNQTRSSAEERKSEKSDDDKSYFIGVGIRGNVYINDDSGSRIEPWKMPSFGGEAFFGKWFNHKVGARIFVAGGSLHPFFQEEKIMEHEKFLAGRLDLVFNLTNCVRQYSPDRFYNLMPYAGIGFASAFNATNRPDGAKGSSSFMFGGGLMNTFRLSDDFSAYFNLGIDIVDANFDGWKDDKPFNGIFATSVGVVYKF